MSNFTYHSKRKHLLKVKSSIAKGQVVFDPSRYCFGFKEHQLLFNVSQKQSIKGYSTILFQQDDDELKYVAKVIPLSREFEEENHPTLIEPVISKFVTEHFWDSITPHICVHFQNLMVENNVRALRSLPLKALHNRIYKKSVIMVVEYVSAGSLEQYARDNIISLEQWRYIIFGVVYTLATLQHSVHLMHADLHYGNVLIDNECGSVNSVLFCYNYKSAKGDDFSFYIPHPGLLPKLFDYEFSVYDEIPVNMITAGSKNTPEQFHPAYDIHFFMTSLLDLDIPDKVREFILSIFPVEVIPEQPIGDGHSDSDSECSEEGYTSEDMYASDESVLTVSDDNTTTTTTDTDTIDTTTTTDYTSETSSKDSDPSSYLYHGQLRTGVETQFALPSPLDVLQHDFFSCYRKPSLGIFTKRVYFRYSENGKK